MLGILVVEYGLLSQAELDKVLEILGHDASDASLEKYFRDNGLVSVKNLKRLVKAAKIMNTRQKEFLFGSTVVRLGFMNQSVVDLALEEQHQAIVNGQKPQRIGDMLVSAGLLSSRQRNYVLQIQKRKKIEQLRSLALEKDIPVEENHVSSVPSDDSATSSVDEGMGTIAQEEELEELSGAFEILSAPVNILPGLRLQVSEDGMAAYLTKGSGFDRDMPTVHLKDALKKEGIVFGLADDDMLEGFIESSGFRTKPFKVAQGVDPHAAEKEDVEYFFQAETFTPGQLDEFGNMDYRERGKIFQVTEGTVLARKHVVSSGKNSTGFDIYGNILTREKGENVLFESGPGTFLSPDGLEIIAEVSGQPRLMLSGEVKVVQVYTQEGDVGYQSGHIDYDGDVHINGAIQPDFRVSGHNVRAEIAQGANINAQGNLTMSEGIIESTVYAHGDVVASFVRNSRIRCMGSVVISGEVVDSVIICSGACSVNKGSLISSTVSAKMGLVARIVGTDSTKPCHITVGRDQFIHEELDAYKKQLVEIQENMTRNEDKKQTFLDQIEFFQNEETRLAHEQDTSRTELQKYKKELETLEGTGKEGKIQDIEYHMSRLQQNMDYAEKKLAQVFQSNEDADRQVSAIEALEKELQLQMKTIRSRRQRLIQWSLDHPGKPLAKILEVIHARTKIQGLGSDIIVRDDTRAVSFAEVRGPSGYEMRLTSL